jgi:hypothetical protein
MLTFYPCICLQRARRIMENLKEVCFSPLCFPLAFVIVGIILNHCKFVSDSKHKVVKSVLITPSSLMPWYLLAFIGQLVSQFPDEESLVLVQGLAGGGGIADLSITVVRRNIISVSAHLSFCPIKLYIHVYISIFMALPAHSGPWPLIHFCNHFSQKVRSLGRVISPSQGPYLNTGQHKHRINAY